MDRGSNQAEPSTPLHRLPEATPGDPRVVIQPLAVSGLVVSTAALVAALRPSLPQLVAIEPLDGGRFLLMMVGAGQGITDDR